MLIGADRIEALELLEAIHFFNSKGWSPATSTNYSIQSSNPDEIIISRSGVDKSKFVLSDFIAINSAGKVLSPYDSLGVRSSAETEIHIALYQHFPDARCVLHTHSVLGTVLSQSLLHEKKITFQGLEILKGLEGNLTHDLSVSVPIVPNSQDMKDILKAMEGQFGGIHAFLIAGHGLYTWGKSIAAAKRHIETLEFLFECYFMMRRI